LWGDEDGFALLAASFAWHGIADVGFTFEDGEFA